MPYEHENYVHIERPHRWPVQRKRTHPENRKIGRFLSDSGNLTIEDALDRLDLETYRLKGLINPVLTLDPEERYFRSDFPVLKEFDPSAVLYFQFDRKPVAMPCDTYNYLPDNIAAIAAHIAATRAIERHGVASVSEMFTGFTALAAPNSTPWWIVLQVDKTAGVDEINSAWRRLAKTRHPDRGGSTILMAELNNARDDGLKTAGVDT